MAQTATLLCPACDRPYTVLISAIKNGRGKACSWTCSYSQRFKRMDFSGRTFHQWTVIRRATRYMYWECICSCGTTKEVFHSSLLAGTSRSCGCLVKQGRPNSRKSRFEYRIWCGVKSRCFNPRVKAYPYYGGRGITVAPIWMDFDNFIADMGKAPSLLHSIDRIDTNGNYEPGNCRWATKLQQARNTRQNVRLSLNGKTMTLAEWARETGLGSATIKNRIDSGWSQEQALTTPVRHSSAYLGSRHQNPSGDRQK